KSKLMDLLREKKHKMELDGVRDKHEDDLLDLRLRHHKELKQAWLEGENEAFKRALASSHAGAVSLPSLQAGKAQQRPLKRLLRLCSQL
ncbi:MAG: hypothetical protein ABI167_10320, partial [Nitrosospira sp.]